MQVVRASPRETFGPPEEAATAEYKTMSKPITDKGGRTLNSTSAKTPSCQFREPSRILLSLLHAGATIAILAIKGSSHELPGMEAFHFRSFSTPHPSRSITEETGIKLPHTSTGTYSTFLSKPPPTSGFIPATLANLLNPSYGSI